MLSEDRNSKKANTDEQGNLDSLGFLAETKSAPLMPGSPTEVSNPDQVIDMFFSLEFEDSLFLLVPEASKAQKEHVPFTCTSAKYDYGYPVPFIAPEDWQFLTLEAVIGEKSWSNVEGQMLANILYCAERFYEWLGAQEYVELIKSTPFVPYSEEFLDGRRSAVGCWDPVKKCIALEPALLGDYFQQLGIIIHELDHAHHEKTTPVNIIEQIDIEIRAHTNTIEKLTRLEEFFSSQTSADIKITEYWLMMQNVCVAAQNLGLQPYRIVKNFLNPINQILSDYSEKIERPMSPLAQKILKDSYVTSAYLLNDVAVPKLVDVHKIESIYAMLSNTDQDLDSLAPIFSEYLDHWNRQISIFREAVIAFDEMGGYGDI